jgi:hypothetical protein
MDWRIHPPVFQTKGNLLNQCPKVFVINFFEKKSLNFLLLDIENASKERSFHSPLPDDGTSSYPCIQFELMKFFFFLNRFRKKRWQWGCKPKRFHCKFSWNWWWWKFDLFQSFSKKKLQQTNVNSKSGVRSLCCV